MKSAGITTLCVLAALSGCASGRAPEGGGTAWTAHVPRDLTTLTRLCVTEGGLRPTGSEIDAAPLLRWIRRAEREETGYVSPFAGSVWGFRADSEIGPVAVIVTLEKFVSDGMTPVCIAVCTFGNPVITYRYRVAKVDMDAVMAWATTQQEAADKAGAQAAGGR